MQNQSQRTFTIPLGMNIRLDKAVTSLCPDITRSQIQKLITHQHITLNGEFLPARTLTSKGDIIVVTIPEKHLVVRDVPVPTVIAEFPDFVVINKPTGLSVHPAGGIATATLVDWLMEHYPEVKHTSDDPSRPGIVHRLDKDTSGVMVVARTLDGFEALKRQFKMRTITKEYLAVCYGIPSPTEGDITFPLARSVHEYRKFVAAKDGKEAHTHFSVDCSNHAMSLVTVWPRTGRTHQIRVHFQALGHPLIGDRIYHSPQYAPIETPRLLLHARRVTFSDISGTVHTFQAPLDADFSLFLEQNGLIPRTD